MKKILTLSVLIGLSVPTLTFAESGLTPEQEGIVGEHPTPEARRTALENLAQDPNSGISLSDIDSKYSGIISGETELSSKLSKTQNTETFEDNRLKVFTKADWNMIKEHPTATARKTAIETIQKEKGISEPTVSSAELLGAFLQEEKNALKVIEERKKKEAEEKLAKEKEKSDNGEKLEKQEVKSLVKNGWKE